VLFGVLLLIPPASVLGVWMWTRWLARRSGLPRFVVWGGHGLSACGALIIVASIVGALRVGSGSVFGEGIDPGQKARMLAEGISEAMNCGALAFLIAIVAVLWLGFWTWRSRTRPV
jgi:hypothetical protein